MATGSLVAAPYRKTSQLLLLSILTLSLYTRGGDCNVSGSGSSLINPVSGLTLSVDEGSNTLIVSWTDNSLMTMSYFVNYTATVGSTEIASDDVTTNDTDAAWTTTHNITGDFVQSGVNITVSVEAVVADQLCDPAFSSLLVAGEFSPSPEAFTVSEPTSMSLALSWTVPFSQVTPNSFSISYTVDKLTGTLPAMTSVSLSIAIGDADLDTTDNASFRYVLGGLTAYTKYTFNLSSVYGASTSSVVSTTGTTSEALSGPVGGLSANITHDSSSDSFSVSISWSEPSEPNGVILHYNYTVSSNDTITAIVRGSTGSGSSTSVVESMLSVIEPFTSYTVGVVAVNSAGEGEESSVTVESPQTAPGPVGNLQASFDETGSMFDSMTREYTLNLDIVWREPLMPNGVITSYSVTVYQTDNASDIIYSNDTLIAPNVTASVMVLAVTNYTVSVAASTSAGQGDESTVTVESPEAEPGPVGDLGASFVETTAVFNSTNNMWTIGIDITWEEPVYPNGVITAYNVTVYQTDDLSGIVYSNDTLTTPNVTASVKVPAYTDYTVSVAASTSAGQGDANSVTIESPEAVPGPVVGLDSTFSTTERSYEPTTRTYTVDLSVTWGEPQYSNGVITSYQVIVAQSDDPTVEVYRNDSIEAPNVTASVMVLAFTDYTVSVTASTSAGQGDNVTDTVTAPEAAPEMVENLDAAFVSDGSVFNSMNNMWTIGIDITWEEPVYPNGVITAYNVTVYQTDDLSDIVYSNDTLTTPNVTASVMVLAVTNYTVSVAASTSAGQGDEDTVTLTSPEAAPSAPRQVMVEALTSTSIRVSWINPEPPNGVITAYRVTYFVTGSSDSPVAKEVLHDQLSLDIPSLTPFTNYTVYVEAETVAAVGEKSDDTTVVTLEDAPTAPRNVITSGINATSITAEWQEPVTANGIIRGYNISHNLSESVMSVAGSDRAVTFSGLSPFTWYLFTVIAFTIEAGPEASASARTNEAAPTVPLNLVVTDTSPFTVSLDWEEPALPNGIIDNYIIRYYETSSPGSITLYDDSIQETSVVVDNLKAFTSYTFRVSGMTVDEGPSAEISATTDESTPSAPLVVTAANTSSTSIMVSWTPPAIPRGVIISYTITYYLTSTGESTLEIVETTTNATSREVPGLMKFMEYSVYVQASTVAGIGDRSDTVNVFTDEDRPSAPQNLVVEETGPTSIMASWSSPASPNGILLHFNIYLEREGDQQFDMIETRLVPAVEGIDDYNTSFDNLTAFTLYRVEVSAETRIGEGPRVSDLVNTDPDSASPPTNVVVETINSTAIRVSWGYPEVPRGNITGYTIFTNATENGQLNVTLERVNDVSDQMHVFGGLEPFTYYTFRVAAFAVTPEQTHIGQPSEPIMRETEQDIPTQPIGFNLNSVTDQPEQLIAEWSQPVPPNGVITAYTVTCILSIDQQTPTEVVVTTGGGETQTTVMGLQPFTNYDCSVSANTSIGEGPPSNVLTRRTVEAAPSAPRGLTIVPSGATTLDVSWMIPTPANGIITDYTIYCVGSVDQYYSDQLIPGSSTHPFDGLTTSTTLMDLTAFTNYTCSISASTSAGEGPRSDEVTMATDESTPSDTPRNFSAMAINSTSIQLSWQRPATPNGVIVNYHLEYYITPPSSPVMVVLSTMTSYDVIGLNEFTEYTFRLAAVTIGPGPEASVNETTLEDAPTVPLNLVVTDTSPFTVSLDWEEPALPNGIIDNYIIRYYETSSPGSITLYDDSIQETSVVVDNLKAFTSYTFRVSGMTVDEGPSAEISATTDESTPSAPLVVMAANTSSTSIMVSWTPPAIPRGVIISYTITYYLTSTGESTPQTVETATNGTSREVTGLMKFMEYSVYVQASTAAGIGDRSDTVNVFTDEDRPSAPLNLVVEETGPTSIMASWSSPASPNGILLHFNIYLEREGDQQFDMIETRLVPAVEGIDDYNTSFDNLTAFTLYRVEVSAETRIGEGPRVSDLVNTDPDSASPPTNVVVETINSTAIRVSWGYPEVPRGNITGYTIFTNATENGQLNVTLERVNDVSDQMHVFGGLEPFTYYTFRVVAFAVTPEQTHIGQPSELIMRETEQDIPTQPIGFNLNSVTDQPEQLIAEWSQPVPPNGVITAYTVTCILSIDQQTPTEVVVTTGGGETQTTVMGLQPFTNYDCSVSANTSIGEGPPSNVLTRRTVEAAPSAPRGLTIVPSGATTLDISWMIPTPANGIITNYTIYCIGSVDQYYSDQLIPGLSTHPFDGLTTSTTLMDLTAFTNYTCSISASTNAGEGPRSDGVTVATDESTPSDTPRNFAAVAINSTSIQLSWQRPATPNGVIVNYHLEYYIASDVASLSSPVMVLPTMTSYDVIGLNEFTEYTFRLAAVTIGPGPQANATEMTREDVPSAGVVGLTGVNTSSTSLLISWGPPPPPEQNGIIRAYNISYGLTSQNNESMYTDRVTSQTMIELQSLEKFRLYTVVVRPYTIGAGPEASVQVQTDSDLPSEPVNLRYENVTASSITLFWEPPQEPNGVILLYRVTYVEAVTSRTITIQSVDPEIRTGGLLIEALMEYHYYEMRVAASTDKGFGNYSAPLTVLTDEHEPDAPENFIVTVVDSQSVRATWENPLDPNGIIVSFSLRLQLTPGQGYLPLPPDTEFLLNLSPDTFERDIPGLHPFARYEFSLRAATSFGEGSVTSSFAMTNEAAPSEGVRNVSAPAISPRQIDLVWTPPRLENWNGILTNYSISIVAVTNCTEPVETVGVPESPRTETYTEFITGPNPTTAYDGGSGEVGEENVTLVRLEEFQSYRVSVRVWNREGSGPENDVMTTCVTTLEDAPSQPPTLESFVVTSNTTAELTWQPPPPLHQNGIIADYRLRICDNRSDNCRNVSTGSNDTYYQFSGLDPFTEYTVSVAAVTRPGEGPLSLNITNTTFEGLPTMPRNLAVDDFDHSYVVLSWRPPAIPYGNIFSYRIRYQSYKQEISQETCTVGLSEELTTKLSFNLTQLMGDSYYCIQVSGRTGAGFGDISTIVVKLPVGPPPVDVIDPMERPEVVPQPVVDPLTGDDGISDTSAKVSFSLPSEINSNGPVDRALIYVQRMPSRNEEIGTWYESSRLTQEWPQYAALSMNIGPISQGRKRQEGDIEVPFTIGNSSMTCGPTDIVCNGPLSPSADYGVRYTLFSGNQSQEFPFFPGAQFTTERSPSDEQSSKIGAIVGAVVGVLLAILVIIVAAVIGYFVFNSRRKGTVELTGFTITSKPSERPLLPHKNGSTQANNTNKPFLGPSDPGIVPLGEVNKNAAGTAASKSRSPSKKANSRKMMLKDLSEAVRGMLNDSGYIFSEEYEKVTEVGLDHSKEASLMAENRAKNRYTNILAYDHSRVKLSYVDDDPGSDYINASYIPGYRMRRAYVATQGPLPATFDDFWRMVWEQNSHTIIMLTQLVERGRTKCHRYWPGAECIVYGEIAVEMLSEKEKEDWTVREFKLSMEKTSRTVWHYQYTSWPDHGVPDTPTPALDFVRTVRESVLMDHGPLVVHCSAGVGRTGCFIALDTLLQHVEEHDYIDVFGLVSEMRQHRNHMIQTEAQYVFVHKAMVEYIDTHYTGKSPIRFGTFPSLYTNHFAEDSTQMTDYYGDFLSEETHM